MVLFVAMMRESAVAAIFGSVAAFATGVVWLDIPRKTGVSYVAVFVATSATSLALSSF